MANLSAVPTTRTVNGKALGKDVSLTASDVGALPTGAAVTALASTGATSGQVPVANGQGGIAWQTPAAGTGSATSPTTTLTPTLLKLL